MENKNQIHLFWQQHKVNLVLGSLILILGILITLNLNKNASLFKSDLLPSPTSVIDITLRTGSGAAQPDRVHLVWQEKENTSLKNFYTGEVSYQVKYYTGEVTDLQKQWNDFADISSAPPGIREENNAKQITALGLEPNKTYTFGVVKQEVKKNIEHFSNPLTVTTGNKPANGGYLNTDPVSASTNKVVLKQAAVEKNVLGQALLGDVNGDTVVDGWDPYTVVMYLYYNNWTALLASLQSQGVRFGSTVTESEFKQRADLDKNCLVNFSDVDILSQLVHGKKVNTGTDQRNCEY